MSEQAKNKQLELLHVFDAVLQYAEKPNDFQPQFAQEILAAGRKVLDEAILEQEQLEPTVFVIYSDSEAAFWSTKTKNWAAPNTLNIQDFYSKEETETKNLPEGGEWAPAWKYGLLEIQRQWSDNLNLGASKIDDFRKKQDEAIRAWVEQGLTETEQIHRAVIKDVTRLFELSAGLTFQEKLRVLYRLAAEPLIFMHIWEMLSIHGIQPAEANDHLDLHFSLKGVGGFEIEVYDRSLLCRDPKDALIVTFPLDYRPDGKIGFR